MSHKCINLMYVNSLSWSIVVNHAYNMLQIKSILCFQRGLVKILVTWNSNYSVNWSNNFTPTRYNGCLGLGCKLSELDSVEHKDNHNRLYTLSNIFQERPEDNAMLLKKTRSPTHAVHNCIKDPQRRLFEGFDHVVWSA